MLEFVLNCYSTKTTLFSILEKETPVMSDFTKYVLLSHLEFLYFRKWMRQNFNPLDQDKVKFPDNAAVFRLCTEGDKEQNPVLRLVAQNKDNKLLYLLEADSEENLTKCVRVLNAWYGEFKKEFVNYLSDPKYLADFVGQGSPASKSKLDQLKGKFSTPKPKKTKSKNKKGEVTKVDN